MVNTTGLAALRDHLTDDRTEYAGLLPLYDNKQPAQKGELTNVARNLVSKQRQSL